MIPCALDATCWVYASAYARARGSGRADVMKAVADAYVLHIAATTEYSRALAREIFGREIAQVLLLHVNRLNADLLPRVLAMLRDRGARFVSLDRAMSDSAYITPDLFVGSQGLSWLQRWAIARGVVPAAEPREEAWVANYATRGVLPDTVVPDTTSARSR